MLKFNARWLSSREPVVEFFSVVKFINGYSATFNFLLKFKNPKNDLSSKKFGYEKACENFMYKSTKREKLTDCQSFADVRMNADCKS